LEARFVAHPPPPSSSLTLLFFCSCFNNYV
jgi:hypothetical protein